MNNEGALVAEIVSVLKRIDSRSFERISGKISFTFDQLGPGMLVFCADDNSWLSETGRTRNIQEAQAFLYHTKQARAAYRYNLYPVHAKGCRLGQPLDEALARRLSYAPVILGEDISAFDQSTCHYGINSDNQLIKLVPVGPDGYPRPNRFPLLSTFCGELKAPNGSILAAKAPTGTQFMPKFTI